MPGTFFASSSVHPERIQTPTLLQISGSSSPGATSHSTASRSFVAGRGYLLFVHTMLPTIDPDQVTISEAGNQTWTELTNAGRVYTTGGGVNRRLQCFKCFSDADYSQVLTINYTNTPDICDWALVDLGYTTSAVVVNGSEKRIAAAQTIPDATMTESLTMNAVANSRNRWLSVACGNVNAATFRGELAADTGGDQDWTTLGTFGSGSSRARKMGVSWRNATNDTTPGWFVQTGPMSWFTCAVEIDYAIA